MKKLVLLVAIAALCLTGCKSTKKTPVNGPFDCDVTYIGYAESHGADLIPGDVPIPSGITFKLWHMVKEDGTAFIGTKIEEKILWFIPLEYGKHVWKVRPGEWDDPGHKLGKAYDWANVLDKNQGSKVNMTRVGSGASFRRVSDGYIEGFSTEYSCWQSK